MLSPIAAAYRFRDIHFFRGPKVWILGTPWRYRPQKREDTSGTYICIIVQNFTRLSVALSPRYLSPDIKKYTSNDISEKTHTSVAFAG